MKYKAKPNSRVLVIWFILFCILTGLVYWFDEADDWWWPLSLGGFLPPVIMQFWMQFVSYKIENHTLKVTPFLYWKNSLDLNKLISVRKKKSNVFQRFFGMPSHYIELYMERDGHMELWADDESLFEKLKVFERTEKPTLANG